LAPTLFKVAGKEAGALRKVLFGLILVLAAFAGGAAVNGPGLTWLKATIKARLDPTVAATPRPPETPSASHEFPASPLPPLTTGPTDYRPNPLDATHNEAERSIASTNAVGVAVPAPRSDAPTLEPPMPDPEHAPSTPLNHRTTDPAVAPASQPPAPAPAGHRDWSEIRRRMRELGVSRYEIEGEPNGRVRFRCLIPLAGRRAVGQQFEGEGDTEEQAAEAALRRVALWKATEMVPQ
jgi:hypothetical protein